jgi:dTMP kinase
MCDVQLGGLGALTGKGFFICIEGLDGCGKTTQTKILVRELRKRGYEAVYTAEPSRGKIGKFIKRYCLHGEKRVSSIVEALLFAADRYEHVENEVAPALKDRENSCFRPVCIFFSGLSRGSWPKPRLD